LSCETWSELVSKGERLLREGSPERLWAERHFSHCPSCAERAFLLDPSWALNRLEKQSFTHAEIASLKLSLLEAGRLREVESSVRPRRRAIQAAAALAVLTLVVAGGVRWRIAGSFGASGESQVSGTVTEARAPTALGERSRAVVTGVDLSRPTVGSVAPAAARVYDFGQEDFSLVMVVHETLDL
jgi:hypothetical protein